MLTLVTGGIKKTSKSNRNSRLGTVASNATIAPIARNGKNAFNNQNKLCIHWQFQSVSEGGDDDVLCPCLLAKDKYWQRSLKSNLKTGVMIEAIFCSLQVAFAKLSFRESS